MAVQRVSWQKGGFRPVRDLVRHQRHLDEGARLAGCVLAHREANPGDRIVLVGHSAGAAVVLAAAERLPPGSVDRIVLLAPAVSAGYDLAPALRCAREGVDSFHSPRDGVLSTFVVAFGTADRRWQASGGWFGFHPPAAHVGEEDLSAKLRQHPWSAYLRQSGNFGGHFRSCSIGHLREQVLPLICPGVSCAVPQALVSAAPAAPTVPAVVQAAPALEAAPPGVCCGTRPGPRVRLFGLFRR